MATSAGRVVPLSEIAELLGVSAPAADEFMQGLQASGFPVRAIADRGYRLTSPYDAIMPDVIFDRLKTSFVGRTILHTAKTGSTNDDAKELGRGGYRGGTVFIAESQSGGKGRIGREWSSPPGGIWMSVLLRPKVPAERVPGLSLVIGYAVTTAIREALGLNALLKWPNDVLIDGKKVCGILCEMRNDADSLEVVAGIGINANLRREDLPPEVRETAATLRDALGQVIDRNALIVEALNRLETCYSSFLASGLVKLAPEITKVSAFIGEAVTIGNLAKDGAERAAGTYRGIDAEGRAVIETPGGATRVFSAGDLSLRVST